VKAYKADDAVRQMFAQYNEIKNELGALKRRGNNNLLTGDIVDILSDSEMSLFRAQCSLSMTADFLKPLAVVVPKDIVATFESSYASLEADTVQVFPEAINEVTSNSPGEYAPQVWRWDTFPEQTAISAAGGIAGMFSPIVPDSLQRISSDSDGNVLFTLWALCGYGTNSIMDGVQSSLVSQGIVVKDLACLATAASGAGAESASSTNSAAEGNTERVPLKERIAKMQARYDLTRQKVMHQLKPQYSVVFEVWMHLKIVQVFVESVLQYGLPDMDIDADRSGRVHLASHFVVGFFRPKDARNAKACVAHLSKVYGNKANKPKLSSTDEARVDTAVREAAAKMGMDSTGADLPFILLEFPSNSLS
jgi:hypothetical protein